MAASRLKPEDLWKLEFPASQDHSKATSMEQLSKHSSGSCATLPDLQGECSPPMRARSMTSSLASLRRPPTSSNSDDWEVKMLVEEFEKKIKEDESSRRHSSYDALSWNRVLSRNLTHGDLSRRPMTTSSPYGSQEEGRRKHLRRKHSLRDDRLLRSLAARQAALDARPKLTRFASLDVPRYNRYRYNQHNNQAEDSAPADRFPQSASSDHLTTASRASLKRRAFFQSRQRQNSYLAGQSPGGNEQQRLLAWRSLDEECETNVIGSGEIHQVQETSFSNECLWQPDQSFLPHPPPPPPQVATAGGPYIAGWPSTPCLPTIKEDSGSSRQDRMRQKFSASGSRSYSETCLVDTGITPVPPPLRRSSSSGKAGTSSETSTETTIHEEPRRMSETVTGLRSSEDRTDNLEVIPTTQDKEESVAISIPDTEPIWSLP